MRLLVYISHHMDSTKKRSIHLTVIKSVEMNSRNRRCGSVSTLTARHHANKSRMSTAQITSWNVAVLLRPHAQTHADISRRPPVSDPVTGVLSRLSELAPRVLEDGQCCPLTILLTYPSLRPLRQRPSRNPRLFVPRVEILVDPTFVGSPGES